MEITIYVSWYININCALTFRSKAAAQKHYLYYHKKNAPTQPQALFYCRHTGCNMAFRSKYYLDKHQKEQRPPHKNPKERRGRPPKQQGRTRNSNKATTFIDDDTEEENDNVESLLVSSPPEKPSNPAPTLLDTILMEQDIDNPDETEASETEDIPVASTRTRGRAVIESSSDEDVSVPTSSKEITRNNISESDEEVQQEIILENRQDRRNNLGDDDILRLLDTDTEEAPAKRTRAKKTVQPARTAVRKRGRPRKY